MTIANRRSEPGLDLYRALVVLMMFVVHARRLQTPAGAGPLESALAFFMWAEPFIAASFLFIAGAAASLAHERAGSAFLPATLRRALGLYALAMVLFVPQYGLELPDLLVSPGILSAIAVALASTALALRSRAPELALGGLGLGVLGVTAFLDRSGATVPGLNAGPGGAFPLIAFAALGALAMRAWRRTGWRAFGFGLALAVPLLGVVLWLGQSWITERSSLYRVHDGQLALLHLTEESPRAPVRFWNHSALGALGLFAPLLASLWVALSACGRLAERRMLAPMLLLGRHALGAYVAHLGLLGVVELAGLSPGTPVGTWGLCAGLALACVALAWALEARAVRTASASRGTPPAGTGADDTGAGRSPRRQT